MTTPKQPLIGVADINGIGETRTPTSIYVSSNVVMVDYIDAEGNEYGETLVEYSAWKEHTPNVGAVDFGSFFGPFVGVTDPFPLVEDSRKKLVLKTEAHLVDFLARALNAAWKIKKESGR